MQLTNLHLQFCVLNIGNPLPLAEQWNIQNAKLQMQIRELQLESSKNQLRSDVEQAYTNAKAAVQSYVANKKSMEAAGKSYNAFEKRYNAGMLGTYEFQQAKNSLAVSVDRRRDAGRRHRRGRPNLENLRRVFHGKT